MPKIIRVALAGLGAVNSKLLLLAQKQARIERQYDIIFRISVIADSSGAAHSLNGFDPIAIYQLKTAGGRISNLSTAQPQGTSFLDLLQAKNCDLLFEGTPVNLQSGEPGLTYTRQALQQGINVVLANKGPLIHQFHELTALANTNNADLAYSATVCGALPVINIGQRDLVAAEIKQIRGIFNATSNYILAEISSGATFEAALLEAQQRGIAEADPSLDVDGWDTANKLVIIANSLLGIKAKLSDVAVTGIRNVTVDQLKAEQQRQQTTKLLASAQLIGDRYQLTVAPTVLSQSEFLAGCHGWEMGVEIHTDIYGTMYHKIWEDTPIPTAAAMMRDAINMYSPVNSVPRSSRL